jgi:hypothetical protein
MGDGGKGGSNLDSSAAREKTDSASNKTSISRVTSI